MKTNNLNKVLLVTVAIITFLITIVAAILVAYCFYKGYILGSIVFLIINIWGLNLLLRLQKLTKNDN